MIFNNEIFKKLCINATAYVNDCHECIVHKIGAEMVGGEYKFDSSKHALCADMHSQQKEIEIPDKYKDIIMSHIIESKLFNDR